MDLTAFSALLGPRGTDLLAQVTAAGVADDDAALALGTRLRRDQPPALVAAALTQARLRERARAKFGADAARLWFTPAGLEQATRAEVARHRAARLAARLPAGARVADLCCGIGADLLALAAAGLDVDGVELDPLTAAVAAANAAASNPGRCRVVRGDATAHDLAPYDAVFCDPARRGAFGRVFDPGSYAPPWPFVRALLTGPRPAAAKVAPGIPHEIVPPGVEAEWVSVRGEVKEAGLYAGPLATGVRRRATLLPGPAGGAPATLTAEGPDSDEEPPPVGPPARFLYEPDGAVVRAHLVGAVAAAVGGRLIDPTIAYVTADRLVPTPFATAYEVTDALPFSVPALRALLRTRGVGRVTVKKRGSAVTPEGLRRQLRLKGDEEATVVLTRCAGAPSMLLVEPVSKM